MERQIEMAKTILNLNGKKTLPSNIDQIRTASGWHMKWICLYDHSVLHDRNRTQKDIILVDILSVILIDGSFGLLMEQGMD